MLLLDLEGRGRARAGQIVPLAVRQRQPILTTPRTIGESGYLGFRGRFGNLS
jgi:hypothetical protein